MKCVKILATGEIKRIMKYQARTLVDLGLAKYVGKEEYKTQEAKK